MYLDIDEEGPVQLISYASDTESASLRLVHSEKLLERSVHLNGFYSMCLS